MKKINNIVFDIGGVLVENSENAIKTKFNLTNDKFKEIKKSGNIIKPSLLGEKNIMDCFKDLNSNDEMLEYIFNPINYDVTIPINFDLLTIIDDLKAKGYKIYALSNMSQETFDYIAKKIDYNNRFDGGIISFQAHLLKPNKKIFDLLFKKYNLDIEETVYFDDNIINVDKGNLLGIESILFLNNECITDYFNNKNKQLILK